MQIKNAIGTALLFYAALGIVSANRALASWAYTDLYTAGTPAGFSSVSRNSSQQVGGPTSSYQIFGGQLVGYGSTSGQNSTSHALLWTPSSPTGIDLNPSGFAYSFAFGTNGSQQVGTGQTPADFEVHAMLWNGSASNHVVLNPSGFEASIAYGTNGTQQVGFGVGPSTSENYNALLWNGSPTNYVNLHPSSLYQQSIAYAVSGTQQVGFAQPTNMLNIPHAMLWNGSAASFVDLNPTGFTSSTAYGTNGTQEVGSAGSHAFLWNGSATSFVDLNPTGFTSSAAFGIDGTQQVGSAGTQAAFWNGSAASYVNLGALLPATFTTSIASTISGDTIYGWAQDTSGNFHAIEWTETPEPSSLALLSIGGITLLRRRRNQ